MPMENGQIQMKNQIFDLDQLDIEHIIYVWPSVPTAS